MDLERSFLDREFQKLAFLVVHVCCVENWLRPLVFWGYWLTSGIL